MTDHNVHVSANEIARVLRGIQFALVSIILGFCYVGLRGSLAITDFRRIFADMLEGSKIPALTAFVMDCRLGFTALACFIPVAAISTFFVRPSPRCFYILGALALLSLSSAAILCTALSGPLFQLLNQLPGIKP